MNPLLSLAEWLFYILCAALPTWLAARYIIDWLDKRSMECESRERQSLERSRRYVLAMRRGR